MKASEIKKFLISSLNADTDTSEIARKLNESGISSDFKDGFRDRVLNKVFTTGITINREVEFVRSMNFNSFLGLSDSYDESIVCLLTGN